MAAAKTISTVVVVLAVCLAVANALTWTSPTPQFNTYAATSTISGPFVAQSGDKTYTDTEVFASYTLGSPCSGTKECSPCVGSGTGPIDYSCPCTIDFAANVTSNDGCAITGQIAVPGNSSEPVASYLFGWAVKAAPVVTGFIADDGKAYADLSAQSNMVFRITGTDLLTAVDQVEVSIAAINTTTDASCATVTVSSITMVSRSSALVNVGLRSALASADGCVFVLQSFKRFNFTATMSGVTNVTATLTPSVTDTSATAAAVVNAAGDAITFTVTGSNLPTSTEQASDFYTASFSSCGSVTLGAVTCTSRTSTSASCEATFSGGDAQNCVLSVAPKRWGVTFPATAIAQVVDVRLSTNSGYFTMSGSSVVVNVKTPALFNPSSEHYWFEWVLTDPSTGALCGTYLTNGTSTAPNTGCPSSSFTNGNIACTLPAQVAGNGCFLRAQLHRRTAASDLTDVGFVGYAGSMAATTQYFDYSQTYQNMTFTFGTAGVGGGFRKVGLIQYNVTGTGCSGNVAPGIPSAVCRYFDLSYSNGLSTVVCEIDTSALNLPADGYCEVRASVTDIAARDGSAFVGYIVQGPPSLDVISVGQLGFTDASKLVTLSGTNLPLFGETYSVEYTTSPSGCFSPAVAGLCASDGLGVDPMFMDCLIDGTFTDVDICSISIKVNRLGAVSAATSSNTVVAAVKVRQVPQILSVLQQPYVLYDAGVEMSFSVRALGLPDVTAEGASAVSVTFTLQCTAESFDCTTVSLASTTNASVTTVSCLYTPGSAGSTYDLCPASVSVKRYGQASFPVSAFMTFVRPDLDVSLTRNYVLNQNLIVVIMGLNMPRAGEEVTGYMKAQSSSEQQPLLDCVPTPNTDVGRSLSCRVNTTFSVPEYDPVYFYITRMGAASTSAGQQGLLSTAPFPFTPRPLPGVLISPATPLFLNFTGFYMNSVTTVVMGVSIATGTCVGLSQPSSGVSAWASCAAGTVISANEIDCRVATITNSNPRSGLIASNWNQIDGCFLYALLDGATPTIPIAVFVNQPVLTAPNTPNLVLASADPSVLTATGTGLPPVSTRVANAFHHEVLTWQLTSDSSQCDMSLVKQTGSANVNTLSSTATFTASESLDNCNFSISVVRSGFASNSIPYGRFVARTQPIASAAKGFGLPSSYVTFSANYPPVDADSFVVDFTTVCGSVANGPNTVSCTVQGSVFNCSVSFTETEHDCTVQASVDRAGKGYGTTQTVGKLLIPPRPIDDSSREVVAAADTLVSMVGTFFPETSDSSKSIALTVSGTGAHCTGSIACTNVAWSFGEVNCTVNAPVAFRGCQVSAVITRFGVQSTSSVQFTVVEPPFTPFSALFLFETEVSPPSDLFPKIVQGFEAALNVSGGVSVKMASSKRAVQAAYIGNVTFSTYDAVTAANQLRTDQAAQQAFLNSIFLYTSGQASVAPGSSLAFDGASISLPPTAPPVAEAAPQAQGVTGGLDGGSIAAIVVVCGIALIVAVVLVILALVGVICKPDVSRKSTQAVVAPTQSSAAAPAADADDSSDASSSDSSDEEDGEEEEEESESAEMAAVAPAATQVTADADHEEDEEEDEESSESSSDEESSSVEESDE